MKYIQKIFIFVLLLCSVTLGAQVTATITHVKAPNKGSITLQMNSGTAPYTYEWYKKATPNTIIATSKDLTNLDAGEYCVIIHDAKCCSAEQCFTVKDECSGDYVKVSYKKNSSDCGSGQTTPVTNGKIEIDVPNPADYTYCWKEFPNEPTCRFTTQNIDQIGVGTYYLTVTNINTGCKVTLETKICCCYDDSFELEDPNSIPHPSACSKNEGFGTPLDVVATPTPPTNATGGSIDLNITGGQSSNYTIKWTGPPGFHSADASINNLAPGKYCYTVTDGCTEESDCFDMYVCGDNPINLSLKVKNKPCTYPGLQKTGIIEVAITGGKTPTQYKYVWKGPDANNTTDALLTNVGTGNYCITVTDKSGCTSTACIDLPTLEKHYERKGCTDIWTCGENEEKKEVYRKDHGETGWRPDPLDCRYRVKYCNDNLTKVIRREGPISTTFDDCSSSCIANEYCWNGSVYQTHFGEPFEGLNDRCEYVKGCFFPTIGPFGRSCIYSRVNRLKQAMIFSTPQDLPPNGACHWELWCDGKLIDEFNGNFKGSPCERFGLSSEDINERLNQETADLASDIIDGKPILSPSVGIMNQRVNDAIKSLQTIQADFKIVSIFPNPFTEGFSVTLQSPKEQQITGNLVDLFNNNYSHTTYTVKTGINSIEIKELSELSQGLYIIELIDAENRKVSEKVRKE